LLVRSLSVQCCRVATNMAALQSTSRISDKISRLSSVRVMRCPLRTINYLSIADVTRESDIIYGLFYNYRSSLNYVTNLYRIEYLGMSVSDTLATTLPTRYKQFTFITSCHSLTPFKSSNSLLVSYIVFCQSNMDQDVRLNILLQISKIYFLFIIRLLFNIVWLLLRYFFNSIWSTLS